LIITGKQIALKIAKDNDIDKKFCIQFVKEFFDIVTNEIKSGENVTITGFGQFQSFISPARPYHTPDGKEGICAEKRKIKFFAGDKLKDYLEN
jgi:nucleoid DNA-binding protein